MRKLAFVWLAILLLAPSAFAQEASTEDGLGPYRFGMSSEAVRATAPNAHWTLEHQEGSDVLTGGPRVALGGRMDAALVFVDNELRRIVLVGIAPGDCFGAVSAMVETVEPLYGRFASLAPYAFEEGRLTRAEQTALGSEVRVREIEGQPPSVASARYGAMYVVVQGQANADGRCKVTLTLGPQSDWERPERNGGISWAQLDAAQSLPDPVWRERPDANSFARVYPVNAIEQGVSGSAVLDCLVMEDGRLSCLLAHEQPAGWRFGAAALQVARDFRVDLASGDASAAGRRVRIPIRFNVR